MDEQATESAAQRLARWRETLQAEEEGFRRDVLPYHPDQGGDSYSRYDEVYHDWLEALHVAVQVLLAEEKEG